MKKERNYVACFCSVCKQETSLIIELPALVDETRVSNEFYTFLCVG